MTVTNAATIGSLNLTATGTALSVNNNGSVGGNFQVLGTLAGGATTISTLSATNGSFSGTLGVVDTISATKATGTGLAVTSNATVGGTLTTTGATNGSSATYTGNVGLDGLLRVGNSSTPGRIRMAATSADYSVFGVNSSDDATNTRITLSGSTRVTTPGCITYVSIGSGSSHNFFGDTAVQATSILNAGKLNLTATGVGLAVTNNATVGGTLVVTGATTFGSISVGGVSASTLAATAASGTGLAVTSNATVGGTLIVTGATTQTGILTVNNTMSCVGLTITGGGTSLLVNNNATISGGLTVVGASSLQGNVGTNALTSTTISVTAAGTALTVNNNALISGGLTISGAATALTVANNATIGGTLQVTGTVNTNAISCTTLTATATTGLTVNNNAVITGGLTINGTGAGLVVTNNATVGGTLTVTGNVGTDGTLRVGNSSTPGRIRIAASSTDYSLIGVNSSDDATNTRIVLSAASRATTPGCITYVSIGSGSSHLFLGDTGIQATSIINAGKLNATASGVGLAVTNNATVGGTLQVIGTANTNAISCTTLTATAAGTALTVTNNALISGGLTVGGAGTALSVTNNATIGGTTTTNKLQINSTATDSLKCFGSALVDQTLFVTGGVVNGGFDFKLGNTDQTTRGNSGSSRAFVKDTGSILAINFNNDFTGGVRIDSPVFAPQFIKSGMYNSGAVSGTISFTTPFATIPHVVVTQSTNTITFIGNITTTSFDFGRQPGVTVNFWWIATTAGN